MEIYSVKQIAEKFKVNQETVRRWIRNGELSSTQHSKKEGNLITEIELNNFMIKHPKYRYCIDDTCNDELKTLLTNLIHKRDKLNEQILLIQELIEKVES